MVLCVRSWCQISLSARLCDISAFISETKNVDGNQDENRTVQSLDISSFIAVISVWSHVRSANKLIIGQKQSDLNFKNKKKSLILFRLLNRYTIYMIIFQYEIFNLQDNHKKPIEL